LQHVAKGSLSTGPCSNQAEDQRGRLRSTCRPCSLSRERGLRGNNGIVRSNSIWGGGGGGGGGCAEDVPCAAADARAKPRAGAGAEDHATATYAESVDRLVYVSCDGAGDGAESIWPTAAAATTTAAAAARIIHEPREPERPREERDVHCKKRGGGGGEAVSP
jgi:hypothetical protein